MGQDQPDQQCLLLARGAHFGRHLLGAVADDEVGAVGAVERAAGGAVALAAGGEQPDVVVLQVDGRPCLEACLERADKGELGPGKDRGAGGGAPGADRGGKLGNGEGARGGNRNAGLGHDAFEGLETRRLAHLVSQEAVALLQSKTGAEFDKAYLLHELSFHQGVVEAIKGTLLPAIKNDELRKLMNTVLPGFEHHLAATKDAARKIGVI